MGTGSLLRSLVPGALAAAASLQNGGSAWPAGAAPAGLAGRLLIEEGGVGMSAGMKAGYIIISVVLVVVSGLMVSGQGPAASQCCVLQARAHMQQCRRSSCF